MMDFAADLIFALSWIAVSLHMGQRRVLTKC